MSGKRLRADGASARSDKKGGGGVANQLVKVASAVLIAGAAVLAWQGYRATMTADMFMVSGVDVRGAKHLGEKDLREIAGIFRGQNIFRADLGAAVQRASANLGSVSKPWWT